MSSLPRIDVYLAVERQSFTPGAAGEVRLTVADKGTRFYRFTVLRRSADGHDLPIKFENGDGEANLFHRDQSPGRDRERAQLDLFATTKAECWPWLRFWTSAYHHLHSGREDGAVLMAPSTTRTTPWA